MPEGSKAMSKVDVGKGKCKHSTFSRMTSRVGKSEEADAGNKAWGMSRFKRLVRCVIIKTVAFILREMRFSIIRGFEQRSDTSLYFFQDHSGLGANKQTKRVKNRGAIRIPFQYSRQRGQHTGSGGSTKCENKYSDSDLLQGR